MTTILIIFENRFAAVSTIHEVVDLTRILHTKFARHAIELLEQRQSAPGANQIHQ